MDQDRPVLQQARDAYRRRAWADAFDLLRRCDDESPLQDADLERLMWSAGMLDRDADLFEACDRLFHSCAKAGQHDAAAYWAYFHGFRSLALREHGRASGWLQRAREHAQLFGRECAAHGYLLLPAVMRALGEGDLAAATSHASQALAIGERCHDADLRALSRSLLGRAHVRAGRVEEGIALLDEAMLAAVGGELKPVITGLIYCQLIACCRQVFALERSREWTHALHDWCSTQPQLVQFSGVCQLHHAEILELGGAWQDAIAAAQTAGGRVAQAITADTKAGAAYQEAEIRRLRGEYAQAEAGYRQASALGMEPQPGLALLRLAQGDAGQGAAMLRRQLAAISDGLERARLLPALIEILLEEGAAREAREHSVELQEIAARYSTRILQAMAAKARGLVELHDGDAGKGLALLQGALATWSEAGAPYITARLRVLLARACRMLRDPEGERLHLDAARAAFEALGAMPDLRRLESAMSAAAPPASAARGLTQRELEVLRLLASGQTNKRIALNLGLSEKTVDRHVSNIFQKLDVPTRAAATAFAYQRRLV